MLPADLSHSFAYVESDVPQGMTLHGWRREQDRAQPARRRGLRRLLPATAA